jgi:hypothetical protein
MYLVLIFGIVGWATTIATVGFYALKESAELVQIRKRRMLRWVASSSSDLSYGPPGAILQ